jgi:hypothetical protein
VTKKIEAEDSIITCFGKQYAAPQALVSAKIYDDYPIIAIRLEKN